MTKEKKKDRHYWPREDRPWYELNPEDMSHQHQESENRKHRKAMRKRGKGPFMEKYREKHEDDFMQEHECGRGDCPDHEKKPLDWDFI